MTDNDSIGADRLERSGQLVIFDEFATDHVAAIPERAVEGMQFRLIERFDGINRVQDIRRYFKRRHELREQHGMIVEIVGRQQSTDLIRDFELSHVLFHFPDQASIDAIKPDIPDQR